MSTIPAALDPTLDKETVLKLRTIGVEYLSTHWSSYWQEWEHHVLVSTPSSRHVVVKNDQGIRALLEQHHDRA